MNENTNVDPREIAKFSHSAARWWDKESEFKPLHDINPLRLQYIEQKTGGLAGKTILDVGCGGGILSESMAEAGGQVTGIDMSEQPLEVAKLHLLESQLQVDYLHSSAEQMAEARPAAFDIVTCMEMLEHVPKPDSIIKACHDLVKPGGHVFFSTLNRNLKSYLFAIIGAEYILGLLPKGTHAYANFIRPAELAEWLRASHLTLEDITGMAYNPFTQKYSLTSDVSVNYLIHAQRL